MPKPYARLADRIAARIATGELPIGARLPPQRRFAYEQGIAVSTASRVYEELRNRGLVSGEVGRGTYVANRFAPLDPAVQEPSRAGIDLEIMFRLSAQARGDIAASTAQFFRSELPDWAAAPSSVTGPMGAMRALAGVMGARGHSVSPECLLCAGNGKQAISACFSALAPRGGRIAVEALTYPYAIATARLLGIELVPLQLDEEGVMPDALAQTARRGVDAVYLQPTLQSPLVLTMSQARRAAVADVLRRENLTAIEDRVYGFLRPAVPLAALAPDHVIQIDSLSKRLMPGLSVGLIAAPDRHHGAVARALRAGGWMASALSVALAQHWIDEGLVARIEVAKRGEAEQMFAIAETALSRLAFTGAPDALHGWIALPPRWRGESFAAACAEVGIAVAPGRAFAVTPGAAPSGVRIAFSTVDLATWRFALQEVARLATEGGN
ncbi:PLP-dependent aminotransferase family protein [uncultured Roseobacter sp.]|uniref:aminotransferase-like domain-containing protein n=1 Tax=uncultured Roseobacter sp. TaxID=114847 RepID=UPI00262A7C95|nr:PLP-dependent aminotransferase family protein [uncultured Roseobacter sp.]